MVKVQINLGCAFLLFAWTVTEIIRYAYYSCNLLGYVPYFLVYLRYTLFIFLYPIGVSGELLCCWRAMPIVKEEEYFTIRLPNKWNIAFDFYTYLWINFGLYAVYFPQLYCHMFRQRSKVLGKYSA